MQHFASKFYLACYYSEEQAGIIAAIVFLSSDNPPETILFSGIDSVINYGKSI